MTYRDHLRSDAALLEVGDVLRAPINVLLGVSELAASTLSDFGIRTVFDLATSSTFGAADLVVRAAADPSTPEARVGALPADVVSPNGTGLADAPGLDVGALRPVGTEQAAGLKDNLDLRTIRELALWPPYQAARAILAEASPSDQVTGVDAVPSDLVPMSGRYATERAFYSLYVLADVDDPARGDGQALEEAGPLDVAAALAGPGFARPVRGARLTFDQSWFSEGVALGQLLHSLALAPGESTRVAMIDWSRQQTGTQREQEGQTEMLVADITRKRALSEVQNAVATETQSGFTNASSSASQSQVGGGGGIGLGALTLGGSFGVAKNQASSSVVTGSSGVRNLAASMSQNVADSTHQAASSARDRFASVVRELSQAEHEQLSTRVVANYNHMHAMTVQYYEVVQIFRTVVSLHRFEPCLFVPMALVPFAGTPSPATVPADRIVRRYRATLQAAALDNETAKALEPDAFGLVQARGNSSDSAIPTSSLPADVETALEATADRLRQAFGHDIVMRDGNTFELPDDCVLLGVTTTFAARTIRIASSAGGGQFDLTPVAAGAGRFRAGVDPAVPLSNLIGVQADPGPNSAQGLVTLDLSYRGTAFQIPLQVTIAQQVLPPQGIGPGSPQTTSPQPAVTFFHHEAPRSLLQRLGEDALYYSQVIWRSLDAAAVAQLLAPYTYKGRPLAQVVDPVPVDVSGNLLVFRMPWEARDLLEADPNGPLKAEVDDTDWAEWVRRHADYDSHQEDLVPLPSGGVFAEAVLGRANSAEKLDITRFWNWQDSPIPLQAPDIAALQAGSRARDDTTTPSGFATPIVAFNNPPALPDPTGLSATLGALANGNMFRDASGSAVAQALAAAALAGTGEGATSAGAQAAANLATAANKEVELAKVAAGLVTGGAVGGLGGAAGKTVSEQGAAINEGRSLDERAAGAGDAGNGATAHEAQAAEGQSGKVIDLVGKAIGGGAAKEPTPAPAPSSSSGSPGSTPAPKPPAPAPPKPAPAPAPAKPPAPKK
jgi:hypothetical protein